MEKLQCLVVDDEELARSLLKVFIEKLSDLELVAAVKDPIEASNVLKEHPVDLIFLDIQMPELTGVEFIKVFNPKQPIIFTTAYSEFALEGYELDIVDYLLKPFSFSRFLQAVEKAKKWINLQKGIKPNSDETSDNDFIVIKTDHKLVKVFYSDLLFIQSMREYAAFHTKEGRILSLISLKKLEDILPENQFIRIHKSFIVSVHCIKALEGNLINIGKEKLPVGNLYKEKVSLIFNQK
jgi:DNA-binding LytR/AlgR family response regulator